MKENRGGFCRTDAIMIVDHNETKAFRIIFFPEMHVEQVEIVANNQYLKIKILKQSKIEDFGKWSSKFFKMVKEYWGMQFDT